MASLLLSTGKYLHTAYAVSNIAEEFTNDDWSLSSQEGFGYIGQYIDDSAVDSSDPTDYVWTEFLDEDVDDLDDEGDMPMADFQSQIDALQDQIEVLQGDAENLQSSIEVNASNVADSAQLASEAADIANATGQYFWHDANGAHVSTEENNPEGERNSIWNSLGMLFRKGATNLLAVLAGGASGTDPKGIAVYDGQGNADENIIAEFTNEQMRLGALSGNNVIIKPDDSMEMKDVLGETLFKVENKTSSSGSTFRDYLLPMTFPITTYESGTYTATLSADYDTVSNIVFTGVGSNGSSIGERPISAFGSVSVTSYSGKDITFTFTKDSSTGYNMFGLVMTYNAPLSKSRLITGAYADTDNDAIFIVGNGSADDSRHNALQLEKDGTFDLQGDVKCNHVYSNNLTGSHTANYVGKYTVGNCRILTGNVVVNVSSSNTNTDVSVSFGETFKYYPNVQVTMLNIGGSYYQKCTAAGISTTGFTARVRAGNAPGNVNVNWVAIGELA